MKARVCAPVGKIYPGGVPLVGGCPHSSPTTATRTAHAVRSDFGQATSHAPRQRPTARTQALCPAGSAVAALPRRSTADKKKPASDCTRGGQTVMYAVFYNPWHTARFFTISPRLVQHLRPGQCQHAKQSRRLLSWRIQSAMRRNRIWNAMLRAKKRCRGF